MHVMVFFGGINWRGVYVDCVLGASYYISPSRQMQGSWSECVVVKCLAVHVQIRVVDSRLMFEKVRVLTRRSVFAVIDTV
jgi:hypothetical protein